MNELIDVLPLFGLLVLVGVCSGTLAGLLGIGGGIVNVPALYFLLLGYGVNAGSSMLIATGTSLATIVPTSISSIRAHNNRSNVDWQLVKQWSPYMVVGVICGAVLLIYLDGRYFTLVFAAFALIMAFNLSSLSGNRLAFSQMPSLPVQGLLAFIIGMISVMVGIGGGALGVVILTLLNIEIFRAMGTAASFGLLISLPGVLMLLSFASTPIDAPAVTLGYINIPSLLALLSTSVLFAPIGVRLGSKMNGKILKNIFAVILVVTAMRMLSHAF
jgi:uncharacterized membrane protein YfcA